MLNRSFKEILKELREKKGMTQEELATALDIPASSIRRYESDNGEPRKERMNKLANYFSCSIDYLQGRTDNPEQILSEPSRVLIDSLDLTDEEIIDKMDFIVDGIKLEDDDVRRFIALVRAERSMKKQVPAVQGAKEDTP